MNQQPRSRETDWNSLFLTLGSQLSRFHAQYNVKMRAFNDAELPHFSRVPTEAKSLIVGAMAENVSLFEEMNSHGEALADSRQLLWRSLQRAGWTPKSDIFDKIGPEDVVEVYTIEMLQVFRNLQFFNFISLTLEEIVSFPPGVLVEMDSGVLEFYQQLALRAFRNEFCRTEAHPLDPYIVRENGGEHLAVQIRPKWLSPVSKNEKNVGVIAIHQPQLI